MSEKWFGPKPYGYGVIPIHRKGWLCFAAYLLVIALIVILSIVESFSDTPSDPGLALFGAAICTVIFLIIVRRKGPASWWASDNKTP